MEAISGGWLEFCDSVKGRCLRMFGEEKKSGDIVSLEHSAHC